MVALRGTVAPERHIKLSPLWSQPDPDRGRAQARRDDLIFELLNPRHEAVRNYLAAISGSAGRLVFSLLYFVALANTLSISDFGIFATASAAGVMLSRIVAFGFISTLYRIATVRPTLIGTYTTGYLLMAVISLPLLVVASLGMHRLFFHGDIALLPFALVVFAEAVLWRSTEAVIIVNNGLNRFGRGAVLVILGTVARAVAAVLIAFLPQSDLLTWSWLYVGANAMALLVGILFFYPRQRLRLKPALYWSRLPDSLYVAGAEILFYLQMELDKLLVLSLGGPRLAGIYAIIMRLVDLTAIPIRTFSMLLVQQIMRTPELLARLILRVGIEGGIFLVSTAALLVLAILLHFFPTLLGGNVAQAAPLVILALAVPGLRNLVEYQAELLFARGQMLPRAINLALLAGAKAVLLTHVLIGLQGTENLIVSLNVVFAALYMVSMALTYSALRLPAKSV